MVTLNKNEKALYQFIEGKDREVPVHEIADWFYKDRKRPKNDLGSMSALLRTLMLKVEVLGMTPLFRTSSLGRGSKGRYEVKDE